MDLIDLCIIEGHEPAFLSNIPKLMSFSLRAKKVDCDTSPYVSILKLVLSLNSMSTKHFLIDFSIESSHYYHNFSSIQCSLHSFFSFQVVLQFDTPWL
ncbi:hypothetical protein EUGRSUZ_G00208 [Eucalyptus grandis]|uniref:Uncharacterized protein n=2 Tax=Eucalyptus grandis TaxID=71139 RepID=A0ACC3K0Q7_EUCGR|nr:hypothetical protein EUGRSUZ_G00208 [Eucalyptus grandis]